jgi:16S rRNA (guanine527-N7)-methyltransferase
MISYEDIFSGFLKHYFPARTDDLMHRFEQYLDLLYAKNREVNMVSRQMSMEDYWLYHFLDSLLILKCMELKEKTALDFGSGGGLPGIPIKLICPEIEMTLLDSVGKKVKCLQSIIESLQLTGCVAKWARLEDYTRAFSGKRFDYVFCRSVRLEERFIEPIVKLLLPDGKAIFYKAHQAEDVMIFNDREVFDVSLPELGKRQIIIITRQSLEQHINNKLG